MKKENDLSRCVMGTLRNMENVGNFVTCTDDCYGWLKNLAFMSQHGNKAGP